MNNIQTQLEKSKKKSVEIFNTDEVVEQVKLLENSSAIEDKRIARGLGSNHTIVRLEQELGKKLELDKLDANYQGGVYTIDQIEALAIKYKLRFLKSKHYQGNIPVEVIGELKKFSRSTNTDLSEATLQHNMYILAPQEEFIMQERVSLTRQQFIQSLDPAMFYKISDNHYRLIKKWGYDFTIGRFIKGLFWATPESRYWMHVIMFTLIMAAVVTTLHTIFPVISHWYDFCVLPIITLVPFWCLPADGPRDSTSRENEWYTCANWNKETKLVRSK